jgi:hypothetical protein
VPKAFRDLTAEFESLSAEVDAGAAREAAELPFQKEVAEAAKERDRVAKLAQRNPSLPWYLYAELLDKRAHELKAKGLDASAVALIGASADATAVAAAIENGLLDCDTLSVEHKGPPRSG